MHATTQQIVAMFHKHGSSQYGHEAVTQLQHALQAAWLAEKSGADAELISASLLHDVGHLLHDLPDDAPDQGIDDRHEILGQQWLEKHFSPAVVEPVRLHVDAKRYLCTVDPAYMAILSPPSIQSLHLQGGPMNPDEVRHFESNPQHERAVRLRRWDDTAKDPNLETPSIEYFAKYIDEACAQGSLA
jgi:[1-hydroxy-2-(trimethylamino)ethyl]phosphonate dioxygenase